MTKKRGGKGGAGDFSWFPWGTLISTVLPVRKCSSCHKRTTWLPWCHNCGHRGWT